MNLATLSDLQLYDQIWARRFDTGSGWPAELHTELDRRWDAHRARFPKVFCAGDIGTQVGAGWWPAILTAAEKLTKVLDDYPGWVVKTAQLKEKFGGMRWYIRICQPKDPMWDTGEADEPATPPEDLRLKVNQILGEARVATERACEVCGEPGEARHDGWIKVLCDKHADKREKGKRRK